MYALALRRHFISRHFLVGGDWGIESLPNSHRYLLELELQGKELDHHGYLVDIIDIERYLDTIVDYYRDQMLNEKPEFAGVNPSLENFARILCVSLSSKILGKHISAVKVTLWEHESAWASFTTRR